MLIMENKVPGRLGNASLEEVPRTEGDVARNTDIADQVGGIALEKGTLCRNSTARW